MGNFRLLAATLIMVTLTLPAAASGGERGVTLAGGSRARVVRPEGLERGLAEEWEAFLSIDGGRHYAIRITPHLNLSVRSFEWQVPQIPTADARILIRIGNEKEERAFEIPTPFRIQVSRLNMSEWIPSSLDSVRTGRGESARPGDPGVSAWVEGTRSGDRTVTVYGSSPVFTRQDQALRACAAVVTECALPAATPTGIPCATTEADDVVPERSVPRFRPAVATASLLLRITRLNV